VTRVVAGGAAATAGIAPGDVLLTLGDFTKVNDQALDQFRSRYVSANGSKVNATIRRGTETRTVPLEIRSTLESTIRLEPAPDASPKAVRIRHGITTGTTSP
jgi:C-terminal processing protease CtpA/Prc